MPEAHAHHPATLLEIGLIDYPGAQQAALLGLTDLLLVAHQVGQATLVAHPSSHIPGLRVSTWHVADSQQAPVRARDSAPEQASTLAVLLLPPSLEGTPTPETAAIYTPWLREQHAQGVTIGSICAGAFLLGESGLLSGRRATTHWGYAESLQARFPAIRVDTDQLLIDEGDIITAGGVMSWTDLGLRLIERYLGPTHMLETARRLVLDPPGREQRYYRRFAPRLTHGDSAILKLQHWLHQHGTDHEVDLRLPHLAAQSGLHPRTLLRRFQQATSMSPQRYLQELRINKARDYLQSRHWPIDRVAWEVGYQDTSAFRKRFHHIVGLTPGEYRQRFHLGRVSGCGEMEVC